MPQGKGETVRIVALDRSFHVACYRCEDCGLRLGQDHPCYPLDGHVLCRDCNAKRVQALTASPTSVAPSFSSSVPRAGSANKGPLPQNMSSASQLQRSAQPSQSTQQNQPQKQPLQQTPPDGLTTEL